MRVFDQVADGALVAPEVDSAVRVAGCELRVARRAARAAQHERRGDVLSAQVALSHVPIFKLLKLFSKLLKLFSKLLSRRQVEWSKRARTS